MPHHPLQYIVEDKTLIDSIAEKYGTPLYIYSEKRLKENLYRLSEAIGNNFKNHQIYYAVKANGNPNLVSYMKSIYPKIGCDCSSPGELHVAKLTGISGQRCLYTGNYESNDDLEVALKSGSHINLDGIQSCHRLEKIGLPSEISFRVNPGFGRGRFDQITTGGEKAKFGIPKEKILEAYELAISRGVTSFGLHCFTGSGVLDENYFSKMIKTVIRISRNIESKCRIQLKYISIGGGFGIPYRKKEKNLNVEKVFADMAKEFYSVYNKNDSPSFCIEPGKYLIGDTGILLARVTGIKKSYKTFIGLDAGMETLMRPVLYGAYHRILKIGTQEKNKIIADITGRICENTDRLAVDRSFPDIKEDDLVCVMDTGAYGFSMAHQFCNRPRPAEILLTEKNEVKLIRKRETIEDMYKGCDV